MTRREWLSQNPPPRAAKSTQALLDPLLQSNAKRAELVQLRQKWVAHQQHWAAQKTDPTTGQYATQQVNDAVAQIAEADKQLAATADVPVRIVQLQEELKKAAKCPQHGNDLFRNLNRPEDMFTCEVGPHHLLWTRIAGLPKLLSLTDLSLPGLDYAMTDGQAITRAQWLASHPPLALFCPMHEKEYLSHLSTDRIDVFRCKDTPEGILLWQPSSTGQGFVGVWASGKDLPSLEEAT